MRKLLALLFLFAAFASAQTMILTPSYISTLKARVNGHNPTEWQQLRTVCDYRGANYTTATPDHLPPVYASMEDGSDGYGNDSNSYMLIGTDGNYYEGGNVLDYGVPLAVCYLVLKDGDVTPSGWSYSWNGISLTPQQYGIMAGMQALKVLNKTTPTIARMTPASVPNNWGSLTWRPVVGSAIVSGWHANNGWYGQILGTIDAFVQAGFTNATTAAGNNVLHMSDTSNFTAGDQVSGTNITAGTTISSIVPNVSMTLSANVTGTGVASSAMISDIPTNSCASPGQAPVVAFMGPNLPAAHSAVTFTNIMGPLGTAMNGNTYYISAALTGWSGYGGTLLDTTVGG